mgnify:CR=1 FL=1
MQVVSVASDNASEFNSSYWVGVIPMAALNRAGHIAHTISVRRWLSDDPTMRRICAKSDLIVVQRVAIQESMDRIRFWRGLGKAVAVSVDDDYQRIALDNAAFRYWGKGEVEVVHPSGMSYSVTLPKHPLQQLFEAFSISAGMSPGKLLVEDWKRYGPMFYVPNYADTARYYNTPPALKDPDWITILYGSSMSHVPSYEDSGIELALESVFRKRKNVRFILCGDERIYKRLPVPADRKTYQRYVKHSEWPKIFKQADITISPLARLYDFRRSWIKMCEAGLCEVPIVATRGQLYEEWEQAGFGLWVSNGVYDNVSFEDRAKEWEVALLQMIDNLPFYQAQAKQAREFTHALTDVDLHVPDLISQYQKIIEL